MWTEPLEFGKLAWPEVARAAGEGRVPIVPIGTLEDHGYHLPIDTDVTLVEAVCRGTAERLPHRRCQAIGTPWQPEFAGKVLFFEDVEAPPWYIDGFLNQMRQAGMLDEVAGVVVGELEKCDWREERPEFPQTLSIEDVLERYIEPLGVPALYGYPLGHGERLCTIPLGASVVLNGDDRNLTIEEPALLE